MDDANEWNDLINTFSFEISLQVGSHTGNSNELSYKTDKFISEPGFIVMSKVVKSSCIFFFM